MNLLGTENLLDRGCVSLHLHGEMSVVIKILSSKKKLPLHKLHTSQLVALVSFDN